MINVSAAADCRKNREFVAVFDNFVAARVFLIDGEKQFVIFQTRKFFDDFGKRLICFRIFGERNFDFPFAGFISRRAEK